MASSYADSNGTYGDRLEAQTTIIGYEVRVRVYCTYHGTSRATYERDYESTQPMQQFADACRRLALADHKEEHHA